MSNGRRLMERYLGATNDGKVDDMEEYLAADYKQIIYGLPEVNGIEEARGYVSALRSALSDLNQTIDDIVESGDKVAMRATIRGVHTGELRGIPPSGNQIEIPYVAFAYVVNGKMSRVYIALDKLEYLQQLGAIPR